MSVSQNFTSIPEKKKLKADINEHVMEELEMYLKAAQEDYDWLTLDAVVEQLLDDALKKDRVFRSWLKKQKQGETQPASAAQPAQSSNQQNLALQGQNNGSHHHTHQTQGQR